MGHTARTAARASAPGKVILLGEHAVVYGRTALAAAIDRHVEVRVARGGTRGGRGSDDGMSRGVPADALLRAAELLACPADNLDAMISSNLPYCVGLGSSAALSVALVRALAHLTGRRLDQATVCAHAFEIERIFHGFPSGVDNTAATYGGLIAFTPGTPVRAVRAPRPVELVIALGTAPRQTRATVTALRRRWQGDADRYEALFVEVDWLVGEAEEAIARGDLRTLGGFMNANHALLRRLGVSTDELEDLIALARAAGAWGAKLTGGGGGGAIITLGDTDQLLAAFAGAGVHAFVATITSHQRGTDAGNDTGRLDQHPSAQP